MKITAFTFAAAATLSATPVFAQDSSAQPAATASDAPRAQDDGDVDYVFTRPVDIIVTATRSGDGIPVQYVPASVTLLDAFALENRQTRIVSDILPDVP